MSLQKYWSLLQIYLRFLNLLPTATSSSWDSPGYLLVLFCQDSRAYLGPEPGGNSCPVSNFIIGILAVRDQERLSAWCHHTIDCNTILVQVNHAPYSKEYLHFVDVSRNGALRWVETLRSGASPRSYEPNISCGCGWIRETHCTAWACGCCARTGPHPRTCSQGYLQNCTTTQVHV